MAPETSGCRFCDLEFPDGPDEEDLTDHIIATHGKELARAQRENHYCLACDPRRWARFGRDVYCMVRLRESLDAQIEEDSEEGRTIRAVLAEEDRQEHEKSNRPN